jgi:hypothetical protein
VRTLPRRADENKTVFAKAIESMMGQHAARGMLGSGSTLLEMQRIAVEQLTASFNTSATFAYSLAGHHGPEVGHPLWDFSGVILANMLAYLKERGRNTGLSEDMVDKQLVVIEGALRNKAEHLNDDFAHGIMENDKMKKDPLVSLVANQTNSPGAVQQLGVGTFSQTALVHNYQSLVETIYQITASEEFSGLNDEQKDRFRDYSGSLKDEASSPKPDAGRLQRWGTRLLNFCKEAGMKVATSAVAQVLSKIFVG